MADLDNIYSTAFNYSNWFSSGIDSRTGIYNFTIQVAKILWSDTDPFTLSLTYNPYSTLDIGLGFGWQINLSGYDKSSRRLTLFNGGSYISSTNSFGSGGASGDVSHLFRYLKLKDIKVTSNSSGTLTVTHKDGSREVMGSSSGTITELIAPSGHALRFNYTNGKLSSISDSMGKKINISRESTKIIFTSTDNQGRVVIDYNSTNRISSVTFPDNTVAMLSYKNVSGCHVINRVSLPTGGWEDIEYDANIMTLPSSGSKINALPAAVMHTITGSGLTPIITKYSYSKPNNYLGGGTSASYRDGYDSLFDAPSNYTYSCIITQDSMETSVIYNKYHLEVQRSTKDLSNSSKPLVYKKEITFYADPALPFEQQPAQYNMPKVIEENFFNAGKSRKQLSYSEYDAHGNILSEKDSYGVRKVYRYYPAGGEVGSAPSTISGYPYLVRELETYPSDKYKTSHDKVFITRYQYQNHPVISGSGHYPVLIKEETRTDNYTGSLLETINYSYCIRTSPSQPEVHGRPETVQTIFGATGNAAATQIERYQYSVETKGIRAVKTTERHGNINTVETEVLCKHTGQPLETIDILGVKTTTKYDVLGRVVELTERAGSANYELKSSFYYSSSSQGRSLKVTRTDGKNSQMDYDALGRTKKFWEVYTDSKLVPIWEVSYNGMGQEAVKKQWEEDGQGQTREQSRFYTYDVWGEVYSESFPSGVKAITERNKVDNCIREYSLSVRGQPSDAIITYFDELDNEIGISTPFGSSTNCYDGHGHLYKTVNPSGVVMLSKLDALGREIRCESNTTPQVVVEKAYDPYSNEAWVTSIHVNGVEVGRRMYDRLGRITEEDKGQYKTRYEYKTLSEKPTKVVQPDAQYINYNIDTTLNEISSYSASDGSHATYGFAKKNGLPENANNAYFTLGKTYFPNGMVMTEAHNNRKASYKYSRQGRLLAVTDYFSRGEQRSYDIHGRLTIVSNGSSKISFEYDEYDRVRTETVSANATPIVTHTYTYDSLHRIKDKTSMLNSVEYLVQQYTYDKHDRIASRKLLDATKKVTIETYEYSPLGQLKKLESSGPLSPRFLGQWPIKQQEFEFDVRGNITKVKTNFDVNGVIAVDDAIYSNDTNNRLNSISHSYPGLGSVQLDYDNCGNLKKDQEARGYTYNALGQLVSVRSSNGTLISEYYYGADGIQRKQTIPGQPAQEFYYSINTRLNESQGESNSRTYIVNEKPLGREVRHENQNFVTLFIGDYKNSVLVEVDNKTNRNIVYTPYGEACELS